VFTPIYIINPFIDKQQNLKKRIAELEWSIVEIKHLKKIRSNAFENSFIKNNSESMVVIVDRILRENNVLSTLQRSQPNGENQIRLDLENVKFNTLIKSLVQFSNQYNIDIGDANISESQINSPGFVNATITLIEI
tara:strand:- start:157 stop:564 length:408 start_codon:yes stop_codon:yes gene_type:complete